ncbi:MAG TPA: hypothetical protein VD887_09500 [Allosphingosinicella sp.]|nr:hypothetical protein [Allosphingosinicella sp.]
MIAPAPETTEAGGVPRFFFHVYDDIAVRDEEGLDLPDLAAARRAALSGARSLICAQVSSGHLHLGHRLEVEDEAGACVLVLPFGDAIEIMR